MSEKDRIYPFDSKWGLTEWLSDYATVYAKPELEEYDHNFKGYVSPDRRPDFLVDFNNGPLTSCFVVDGENLEGLGRMLGPKSRFVKYVGEPGNAHIMTPSGSKRRPENAALITQFAPFGRVFADAAEITNTAVNNHLRKDDVTDDFLVHLVMHILGRQAKALLESQESAVELVDRYGLIVGRDRIGRTFKPPAALLLDEDQFKLQPEWLQLH